MRNLLIVLIISFLAVPVFAQDVTPPSSEEVKKLIEEDPEAAVQMIQKLYILEHAVPQLLFPELVLIELKDGSARIEYQGILGIDIGTSEANLRYDIELEPKEVIIARKECPGFPWGIVIATGVGSLVLGIVLGAAL